MGLEDIKAIAAKLFNAAEMRANWQDESEEVGNNVFETETAKSIFCQSIQQAVPNLNQTDKQWLEDTYGVHFSTPAEAVNPEIVDGAPAAARSQRRAADINITININMDIVINACNGNDTQKEDALNQLVQLLIAEMTKEDGDVANFIIALIQTFGSTDKLDFSDLNKLIDDISKKLDALIKTQEEQGKTIDGIDEKVDNLQKTVDDLGKYLHQQFIKLFRTMKRYADRLGIKIDNLQTFVEQYEYDDTAIMNKLGDIYSAILSLTNMFNSFTTTEQDRFNAIMNIIGPIEGDPDTIRNKLDLLLSMLETVQSDANDAKVNTQTIIDLIGNLPDEYKDSGIVGMLNFIMANMATKGDVNEQTEKFKEIVNNLQTALTQVIQSGNTELKQKLDEAITLIKNIKIPEGSDNSALMEMVTNIFNNMLTKDDLKDLATKQDVQDGFANQLDQFKLLVESLQNNITAVVEKYGDDIGKKVDEAIELINGLVFPGGFDDTKIMNKLTEILNNMLTKDDLNDLATKEDLENQLTKFQEMINNLKEALNEAIANGNQNVINTINSAIASGNENVINAITTVVNTGNEALIQKAGEIIDLINNIKIPEGYDDSELKAMITNIFNGMLTKDDLSNLATKDDLDQGFAKQLDNFKLLIEGLQNNITAVVEKYGDDIGKKVDKAIELINGLVFPGGFDDTEIMNKLTQILNNMLTRDDLNGLATKADLEAQLNKFQEMITSLENSVKKCVDEAKKEIIEALANEIAGIEFPPGYDDTDVKLALAQILENMATKGDLQLSFEELQNFINNVKADINKTIEDNADQPVDLSVVEALLNQIKALAEGNSTKLDGVLDNQNTIIALLNGLKTSLEGIDDKVDGLADGIQEIKDLINGLDFHCDCDPSKIAELLGYIIEIKQIVVSLTDNNEGIIGGPSASRRAQAQEPSVQRLRELVKKVGELLGAGNSDPTGIKDVEQQAASGFRKVVKNGKMVVVDKDGNVVTDLSGRGVRR